ncbi:hypothetical protein MP638_000409 [Amoeboaphelidium occidentale]|nr:hypothetical protein MP638_000409 [Amoeboaphelidium occidentale]
MNATEPLQSQLKQDSKAAEEKQQSQPNELTTFVDNILNQLQNNFDSMSHQILEKMDEMGRRLDELERSMGDLMDVTKDNVSIEQTETKTVN